MDGLGEVVGGAGECGQDEDENGGHAMERLMDSSAPTSPNEKTKLGNRNM